MGIIFAESKIELKNFVEASKDKHWVEGMEEELNQIKENVNWKIVQSTKDTKCDWHQAGF